MSRVRAVTRSILLAANQLDCLMIQVLVENSECTPPVVVAVVVDNT